MSFTSSEIRWRLLLNELKTWDKEWFDLWFNMKFISAEKNRGGSKVDFLLGETKLSRVCKDVGVIEWKLWRNEKLIVPGIYQVPFFLECSHFHIFNPHRVENTVLFPILFFWGILAFQRYKITINYFQSKFTVSVFYQNTLVFLCTPFSREMIYIFFEKW